MVQSIPASAQATCHSARGLRSPGSWNGQDPPVTSKNSDRLCLGRQLGEFIWLHWILRPWPQPWPGQQKGTQRAPAPGPPGQGGPGSKAGPAPLHLPRGQFPETGPGPPNQLGTVSGPSGAGKSGDPPVAGVCGGCRPPIQCEGFLCSVVFLTPRRGRGPWAKPRQLERLAWLLFQCMLRLLQGGGRAGEQPARSGPCLWCPRGLGTHVFGLRPAVLRAPSEGVGRRRVPEGV